MANISLEGSDKPSPEKEKVVYLKLGVVIKLMVDMAPFPPLRFYVKALSNNLTNMLSKNMLIKEILKVYGVKSEKKMKQQRKKEFDIINTLVFPNIFEGV